MGFDKIIGQDFTIDLLRSGLKTNHLSPSLLFYGEPSVGKLTTALMTAKALNCTTTEGDFCDECLSCKKINNFIHPDVHVLNIDNIYEKIDTITKVMEKEFSLKVFSIFERFCKELIYKFTSSYFNLKKTVRVGKTTKSISEATTYILGEEAKSKRKKKLITGIEPLFDDIHNLIEEYNPQTSKLVADEILGKVNRINEYTSILSSFIKSNTIPVDGIRKLSDKLHNKAFEGKVKTFIINGIDRLAPNMLNTLLKSIEEPPENSQFILITENYGSLLETIKSRCYKLKFNKLTKTIKREILKSEFNLTNVGNIYDDSNLFEIMLGVSQENELAELINLFFNQDIYAYKNDGRIFDLSNKIAENLDIKKFFKKLIDFFKLTKHFKYKIRDKERNDFLTSSYEIFSTLSDKKIDEIVKYINFVDRAIANNNAKGLLGIDSVLMKICKINDEIVN